MSITHAFLLGVLQGITEFLPISSDGHLALAEMLLQIDLPKEQLLQFDILLHAGTLAALLLGYIHVWIRIGLSVFTHDRIHQRLLLFLIIASIPGAIAGIFFEDMIANVFRSPVYIGIFFLVSALFLFVAEVLTKRVSPRKDVGLREAFVMGVAQAFALLPGLSRSGSTISTGMFLGLSRKDALDFSFMMATPIIFGATLLTFMKVLAGDGQFPPLPVSMTGVLSSFGMSMLAMLFLRTFVRSHSLNWFAYYLLPVAILTILLSANNVFSVA